LFAAVGGIAGGYYSSYLIKKGMNPITARKRAITIGSVTMLLSLIIIYVSLESLKQSPWTAIIFIGTTLFGFQFIIGNIQTLPSDLFHGKNVGTVAGIGGTAAVLGTLITIWMVPVLTKTSYVSFFGLAAVLVPLAWIAIQFISNKKTAL
jgi:ACS family hexuronate transporter-like MFS transporter